MKKSSLFFPEEKSSACENLCHVLLKTIINRIVSNSYFDKFSFNSDTTFGKNYNEKSTSSLSSSEI